MRQIVQIVFFCFISLVARAQWTQLNSGTTNGLTSVFFLNNDTGFVVGFSGTILKTVDGGLTWLPQNSGTNAYLSQVVFLDDNNGIIVGDSGIVLKTINAGVAWQRKNSTTNNFLTSIDFSSLTSGIAVGLNGTIIKTNDMGSTWITLPPVPAFGNTNYILNSIKFSSNNIGYAVGGPYFSGAVVLQTTNGGNNWLNIYENSNSTDFCSSFFINDSLGWAISNVPPNPFPLNYLHYTDTNGINWNTVQCSPWCYSFTCNSSAIFFSNATVGFICGIDGKIIYTTDSGNTWNTQDSTTTNSSNNLYSIFFVNDSVGYAAGLYGTIIKTTNAAGTSSIQQIISIESIQLYPNPNNGSFILSFSDTKMQDMMNVKIYNMLGNMIYEKNLYGQNILKIEKISFAPGMYFIKIINENKIFTQKFILEN